MRVALLLVLLSCGGATSSVSDGGVPVDPIVASVNSAFDLGRTVGRAGAELEVAAKGWLANDPRFLENSEFASEDWRPSKGQGRGWVLLGLCTSNSGWRNPRLGMLSCLDPWPFPVKSVVVSDVWVRESHFLGSRQIGRLVSGDVVAIHEWWVDQALMSWGSVIVMGEVDFPKRREFACH